MVENSEKVRNWGRFEGLDEKTIEEKAQKLLNLMNLKEKVAQMSGDKSTFPEIIKMLFHYNKYPYPAGKNHRLGIPAMKFTDGPRGIVLGHSTCFPVPMARGSSWNIELEEEIGKVMGIEARTQGANFFGGVCINLVRHPAWGRAQETYGEDPFLLGEMGSALIRGTQEHVMACAKHYACNSIENARFKVNVKIGERTLREVYLYHFKKCVDEGVASIMNAYNKVNGNYCGHNPHLLRDILKGDWGFKGFVITDFIWGIREGIKAIKAGVDIEMPFKSKMKPKKVIKWVDKGVIPEKLIDESVFRILRTKIRFAKLEMPQVYIKDKIASKKHTNLALKSARESIVLLKNEDVLPIDKEKANEIVVLGSLAAEANTGDRGSSRVYPPYTVNPLQGIKKLSEGSINIIYDNGSDISKIKHQVSHADYVIIIVGFTYKDEGEYVINKGGDRDSLSLKPKEEELIQKASQLNKKCIVVLEGGSAIITEEWRKKTPGIIMLWYPGMEGGIALAEILFGEINPSGKLPLTFPKSKEQLPFFDKKAKEIKYGYYHGYWLFDKKNYEAAFPFGFGLSYTEYDYSNLRLNKEKITENEDLEIKVDIKNRGSRSGKEIAQLYIGYKNSQVERPVKQLKGFQKVKIDPDETKTITFILKTKDLEFYNIHKKTWSLEKITYKVLVGSSSLEKDLITAEFTIL